MALSYRKATVQLTFNGQYARPKAYEVERFLREVMHVDPRELLGIHLSIVSSTVYLKLVDEAACERLIRRSTDGYRFHHSDGNVGVVTVDHTGLGVRNIRIFELPFEVPATLVMDALRPYGEVFSHVEEKWHTFETYPVLNGVRQVRIALRKHIPSYVTVDGCRAIVIYDGQPRTCSGCGQEGHVRSECLQRRLVQLPRADAPPTSQPTILPLTYVEAARNVTNTDVVPFPLQNPEALDSASSVPPTVSEPSMSTTAASTSAPSPCAEEERQKVDSSSDAEMREVPPVCHDQQDSDTRSRKQRSPKRRKKRRLTAGHDSHDSETLQDDDDHSSVGRAPDSDSVVPGAPQTTVDREQRRLDDASNTDGLPGGTTTQTADERCPSPHIQHLQLGDWANEVEMDGMMSESHDQPMATADISSSGHHVSTDH